MRNILYCFGFLLFLSCSNRTSNVQVVSLPEVVELASSSKSIDTDLLTPSEMLIKDNKLIIHEALSKDMFKVFDFPSFNYLYSFGDKGQGPNDFISERVHIVDNETNLVEIHDYNKIKFVNFSDSSAYIESALSISLLHLKNPINRLSKLNDSIYYFDNIFDGDKKNEFTRQNINTGERKHFSPYPDWIKNIESDMDKYTTYIKSNKVSFSHKKIVVFYHRFPTMKIIDFNGKIIKEIRIKTPNYNFNSYEKNTTYFALQSFLTNDYIYVMWLGKPNAEMMAAEAAFRPEILVFDWESNIVGRYRLDKPITAFTISDETKKLYGVSAFDFDNSHINAIYEYDLPQINND